jgi:hypothetical protein
MKASRSVISLCHVALAIIGLAAGLTMAGCGSDDGVPASTPAQAQASPEAAVQGKAKAKGKPQATSRRDLYREKAQASKGSQ